MGVKRKNPSHDAANSMTKIAAIAFALNGDVPIGVEEVGDAAALAEAGCSEVRGPAVTSLLRARAVSKQRKRGAGRVYHGREMPRLLAALLALALLPLAFACASATDAPVLTATPASVATPPADLVGDGQPLLRTIEASSGETRLTLEVANDPEERTRGLSARTGLAESAGMLFVWEGVGAHTLWMKDMRFALDFIWLDENKTVIEITRDVSPQPGIPDAELARYTPALPSAYVIEMSAGEAGRLGIQTGDVLEFEVGAD
jgi:uncharacterized membrane protein (UPF0127 family)